MKSYTLGRKERLKSKKELANLFTHGQSFSAYPLRVIWRERDADPAEQPVQFAVSVPKKKFPKAVDRNRLKRLIREAYRRNKQPLYDTVGQDRARASFFIIYVAKEQFPLQDIEKAMQQIIRRFSKKWKKRHHLANPTA